MDLKEKKVVRDGGAVMYKFTDDTAEECRLVVAQDGAVLFTDPNPRGRDDMVNFDTAWTIKEDEHGLYFGQVISLIPVKGQTSLGGEDISERDISPNEFIQGLVADARSGFAVA